MAFEQHLSSHPSRQTKTSILEQKHNVKEKCFGKLEHGHCGAADIERSSKIIVNQ